MRRFQCSFSFRAQVESSMAVKALRHKRQKELSLFVLHRLCQRKRWRLTWGSLKEKEHLLHESFKDDARHSKSSHSLTCKRITSSPVHSVFPRMTSSHAFVSFLLHNHFLLPLDWLSSHPAVEKWWWSAVILYYLWRNRHKNEGIDSMM